MTVAVWILQIMLAAAFLFAGLTKVAQPREALRTRMPYVEDFSDNAVKLIGLAEILAAVGLVVPALIGVATLLVPLAAAGLAAMMIGAFVVHARRREPEGYPIVGVLFLIAAAVAWARFGPYQL